MAAPQIVDGGLIQEHPPTLIPFEGAEPIVVGNWHDGVVSRNRAFAAIRTGETAQPEILISVINLGTLEVASSASGVGDGIEVADDGMAYYFDDAVLMVLTDNGSFAALDAPPVAPGMHDSLQILDQGKVGFLTKRSGDSEQVDVVVWGAGESARYETDITSSEERQPAVAWSSETAYVVDAASDNLVVVDLETGGISEHAFETEGGISEGGVVRDVSIGPDGLLFIATKLTEVEDVGTKQVAQKLVVVDTGDWSSRIVDVNVENLAPSPTNGVLAGWGSVVQTDGEVAQSPVYLIDMSTGEPLVGFQGNNGDIAGVQFSGAGAEMYVISHGDITNIDIVDVASQELVGNVSFVGISLVGEAGLMAFHSTPN